MAKPCRTCGATSACYSDCAELRWPDGTLRGSNPGPPPAESLTVSEEMSKIFAGVGPTREDPDAQE